ncbi:hypothetical protein B0H10DRAFT_1957429 [Mycena sp. CBHHK59/15]|nr:hypothetical protein B0H10DRAFT_1957429 [Mycena sp. CBHHK59/15]
MAAFRMIEFLRLPLNFGSQEWWTGVKKLPEPPQTQQLALTMPPLDPFIFYSELTPRKRASALPPPPPPLLSTPVASTQPKLCAPKHNKWQKVDMVIHLITKEFHALGAFLEVLFHGRDFSIHDPCTASHKLMVTAFLDGESNIGMGEIIDLIYHHPQSQPPNANAESNLYFLPLDVAAPKDIKFAWPSLLSLPGLSNLSALRCIGK